jgi:hypothetical protein
MWLPGFSLTVSDFRLAVALVLENHSQVYRFGALSLVRDDEFRYRDVVDFGLLRGNDRENLEAGSSDCG